MVLTDYIVLTLYVAGLIGVSLFLATRVRSSADMFAAGGRSPWWMSGLSSFMTMFSAGTFVVWGGIAYRYGLVAVSINLCYGVAAMLAGWTLAGYWRKIGVRSGAEFVRRRFGDSLVQFYTWMQGLLLIFTLGGTVYALAVIVCSLVPLPAGHALADPATGHLSVPYTSIAICLGVVLVTLTGGLWAVLMTDVLQFIVLSVSVAFVVPLMFAHVGGVSAYVDAAPAETFEPVAGSYTWWFLLGWVVVHYFKIGGDWAFVQRFTCVPSAKDARKSALLFGAMYLVSPLLWMLPAMIYRVVAPIPEGATDAQINQLAEHAYINACREVLPPGMVGLMVAAMVSATASMATTVLNVYAGAFTSEVYQRFVNPHAGERRLIGVGRVVTLLLGSVTLAGALLIPAYGTYTGYIIALTSSLTIPLVLPTIWGLFSRRITTTAAWFTTVAGVGTSLFVKFGLQGESAWLAGATWLTTVRAWVNRNTTVTDWVVGLVVPLACLTAFELLSKGEKEGWRRVMAGKASYTELPAGSVSSMPARICGGAVGMLAVLMAVLAALDREQVTILATFAVVLAVIGGVIFWLSRGAAAAQAGRLAVDHD